MEKFSKTPLTQDALFESHYKEMGRSFKALLESNPTPDVSAIMESFDTAPYALDEKIVKGKGDISYVFKDEAEDRYRIQFLAAPKFGKGVAKVYIGKGKGGRLFVDKIDRFTNPKAMIATVINFFTEHLLSPEGMGLRGFIVDLSGTASIRSIPILKKVIKSALISKIKVADDTFQPQEGRKYLWITKSTLKPADVFNGPGCEGAPWLQGKEKVGDQSTDKKGDSVGAKTAKFDPMLVAQALINSVLPLMKKFKGLELKPSLNNQMKYVTIAVNVEGQPITHYPLNFSDLKGVLEPKVVASMMSEQINSRMKQIADAQKKAKEEFERAMNLKRDPTFYLKQQQTAIEGELNLAVKGYGFKVEFSSFGKTVDVIVKGATGKQAMRQTMASSDEPDNVQELVSLFIPRLRDAGFDGRNPPIYVGDEVKISRASVHIPKTDQNETTGTVVSKSARGSIISTQFGEFSVPYADLSLSSSSNDGGQIKSQTQTTSGKVKVQKDENLNLLIDAGLKNVKKVKDGHYSAQTKAQAELVFNIENGRIYSVSGITGGFDSEPTNNGSWLGENILKRLAEGAFWVGSATKDFTDFGYAINKVFSTSKNIPAGYKVLRTGYQVRPGRMNFQRNLENFDGTEVEEKFEFGVTLGAKLHLHTDVGTKHNTVYLNNYTYTASEMVEMMFKQSETLLPKSQTQTAVGKVAKTLDTNAKEIVRAKYKDPHDYYIIVTYNPNINRVFVKDDGGTSYAASRVMFMHPNKGTAELNSMFTDAVLSGEPRNSTELVKILSKITKLPRWQTA